jgi:hypothetical protein
MALRPALDRQITRTSDADAETMLGAVAFRVDVAMEHGAVRVCPVGEVDIATVGRVRARIDEAMAAGAGRTFDVAGLRARLPFVEAEELQALRA